MPTSDGPGQSSERRGDTSPEQATLVLTFEPPLTCADIQGACDQLRERLQDSRRVITVVCDVGAVTRPNTLTLEALARLQLTARRQGCQIRLYRPGDRLRGLLTLTGLWEILPLHV